MAYHSWERFLLQEQHVVMLILDGISFTEKFRVEYMTPKNNLTEINIFFHLVKYSFCRMNNGKTAVVEANRLRKLEKTNGKLSISLVYLEYLNHMLQFY